MNSPTWREWQPPASKLNIYDRVRDNAIDYWGQNGKGLWRPSDGKPRVWMDILPGDQVLVNDNPLQTKRTNARPGTPSPTVLCGNILLELGRWGEETVDADEIGDALMRRGFLNSRPSEVLGRWALAGLAEDVREGLYEKGRVGRAPLTCRLITPVGIADHRDPDSIPPPPMID
jgi:hypothetical protein